MRFLSRRLCFDSISHLTVVMSSQHTPRQSERDLRVHDSRPPPNHVHPHLNGTSKPPLNALSIPPKVSLPLNSHWFPSDRRLSRESFLGPRYSKINHVSRSYVRDCKSIQSFQRRAYAFQLPSLLSSLTPVSRTFSCPQVTQPPRQTYNS